MSAHSPFHIMVDLDGHLFDTRFQVSVLTAEIAGRYGCGITARDVFKRYTSMATDKKFHLISQRCGVTLTAAQIKMMCEEHDARKYAIFDMERLPMIPGVRKTLRSFFKRHAVISAVSNAATSRSTCAVSRMKFSRYFNGRIYGPDLAGCARKPDPSMVQVAVARSGIPLSRTVMSGDTLNDMRAAKSAGIHAVAYLDPRFGRGAVAQAQVESLYEAGADVVVRDFRQIPSAAQALVSL